MQTLVITILTIAMGLIVFGAIERRGALIVRLDGRVLMMAVIWGTVLLGAAGIGYGCGKLLLTGDLGQRETFWIHVVSGLILIFTGIRILTAAFRHTTFLERRMEKVDVRHDTLLCLRYCFLQFLAGTVCGLLEVGFWAFVIAIFLTELAATAGGYIFGRANGNLLGTRSWAASGALFCALGLLLQLA